MNKQQIKEIIKAEMLDMLNEDVNYNFNFKNKKFRVKFDVNSNPTKKGVKIQFTPFENLLQHPQVARQLANDLQILLNQRLGNIGMTVDFDPDVPYKNVIGFTLKLGTLSNMIINTLKSHDQNKEQSIDQDSPSKIPSLTEPIKETIGKTIKSSKNEKKK